MMDKYSYVITTTGDRFISGEFMVPEDDDEFLELQRVMREVPRGEIAEVAIRRLTPYRDDEPELTPTSAVEIARDAGFKRVTITVGDGGIEGYFFRSV